MLDQASALRALMQQREDNDVVEIMDNSNLKDEVKTIVVESISLEDSIQKTETETLLEIDEPLVEAKDVRVVAICSGKGGVGKTNFTVNMAIAEKRAGREVVIIDIDFGFNNIDVLCGITSQYTLQDVMNGDKTIEEVMIEGPEGIKIIPGGNDVLSFAHGTKDHQRILKEELSKLKNIDTILIDTGAGISKSLLLYTMFAQELVVVTTTEPTAFRDAYKFIKLIDHYKIKRNAKIVINRVAVNSDGERTFKILEALVEQSSLSVKLENLGVIRDDKMVPSSVKAQVPFLLKYPTSQPSRDIEAIRSKLFMELDNSKKSRNFSQILNRFVSIYELFS